MCGGKQQGAPCDQSRVHGHGAGCGVSCHARTVADPSAPLPPVMAVCSGSPSGHKDDYGNMGEEMASLEVSVMIIRFLGYAAVIMGEVHMVGTGTMAGSSVILRIGVETCVFKEDFMMTQ